MPEHGTRLNDPVFSLSGLLDGTPFRFEAGIDQRIMLTALEQDDQSVYELRGTIAPAGCDNCTNQFTIILRDYTVKDPNAPMDIDSTLKEQDYPFQITSGSLRTIQLQQQSAGSAGSPASGYDWEIREHNSNQLVAQLTGSEPEVSLRTGTYNVLLNTTFTNGCSNSIIHPVVIENTLPACTGDFRVSYIQGTRMIKLDTVGVTINSPVALIQWVVNGSTYVLASANIMLDSITLPVFQITMNIYSQGCSLSVTKNVSSDPDFFCTSNFKMTNNRSTDPLQLGHVRVDYTDAAANSFSTLHGQQPSWSQFVIHAILPFEKDANGLPTRKISGEIDCRLFSDNGTDYKDLRQANMTLALPFKP